MRKIIIILIITLATFMGGNIYTNNEQRLSENIGKLSDNSEIQKELNISNDKENERITPEENNVSLTLDNATEEKRKEKITKEEKRVEETKEEKIEVSQPTEEPKVVETKTEPIKEPEPVTPKCDGSNHGIGVGNSNKWFNTQQEAINYFDGLQKTWGDKWERFEIDSETYYKNCPYRYDVWTCPFC